MKLIYKVLFNLLLPCCLISVAAAQTQPAEGTYAGITTDATAQASILRQSGYAPAITQDDASDLPLREPQYIVRTFGRNTVVFLLNTKGKVSEYFLIQELPVDINPDIRVKNATFGQSSDITLSVADGKYYQFYVNDSRLQPGSQYTKVAVAGIAHLKISDAEGYPLESLYSQVVGGGDTDDCNKTCRSGGCGATACTSSLGSVISGNCNVSCTDGYFACCGDSLMLGCSCVRDTCCK